jgi:hypothetical protein
MCLILRAPQKCSSHMLDILGRWPRPACLFRSAQAPTLLEFHVPLTNCFVHRWFCMVHGPKPLLYCHNWLTFGKFQDTECFLIPCACHVSSWLPPSGETCKYATVPSTQKSLKRFSAVDILLSAVSALVVAQFGSSGGTYVLPCIVKWVSGIRCATEILLLAFFTNSVLVPDPC